MLQFFCRISENTQDPCDPNPCGSVTCQSIGTAYYCQCDQGFTFSNMQCVPGKLYATSCYIPLERPGRVALSWAPDS